MDEKSGRGRRCFSQKICFSIRFFKRNRLSIWSDLSTVRLRLDRLIQKIKMEENQQEDPYILLIKRMAVNGKMDFETAKILIQEYRKKQQEEKS